MFDYFLNFKSNYKLKIFDKIFKEEYICKKGKNVLYN